MKTLFSLWTVAAILAGASVGCAADDGFVPLFNGKETTGWKLRNPQGHNSWTVEEGGVLKNTVKKGEHVHVHNLKTKRW